MRLDKNPLLTWVLSFIILLLLIFFGRTAVIGEQKDLVATLTVMIFSFSIFACCTITFLILKGKNPFSNIRFILVWSAIFTQLALTYIIVRFCADHKQGGQILLLVLPYLLAPMTVTVLLGRRMGIFTVFAVSLLGSILVPAKEIIPALSISLLAGAIVVNTSSQVRSRSQLLKSGSYCGLVVLLLGILFNKVLIDVALIPDSKWVFLLKEVIIAFGTSLFLSVLLSGIFPVLEALFGIVTPTGWLERSDLNHPLLRRLQYEAPGTFHHSLIVAQLSESAAQAIGANAFQCRVCAYYHDIGKLNRPLYFTENMPDKDASPHKNLPAASSANILKDHVEEGVELAKKHNLEKRIIDTIKQHHGTSYVSFLYQKALEERDLVMERVQAGLADESEIPKPHISQFTYGGPIPQSREIGILSLADAVESASRSLINPTLEEIGNLVDSIIRHRIFDGQLNESKLTLGELQIIRESFVSTIKSMMHTRISYPKDKTDEEIDQVTKRPDLPVKLPVSQDKSKATEK